MMLHACMSKEIDTRKTFNKVKLGIEDKTMEYYGGMPLDGKSILWSRIPEGSAYSRLKRTSMSTLSKNILKCQDAEVKPVVEEFSSKELNVVWNVSDDILMMEGYMSGDKKPVLKMHITIESGGSVKYSSDRGCTGKSLPS
jgi:hypothetical protein